MSSLPLTLLGTDFSRIWAALPELLPAEEPQSRAPVQTAHKSMPIEKGRLF